ncbi:MAG: hypothetical protein EZS28_041613, partial [Streblomastix strix]
LLAGGGDMLVSSLVTQPQLQEVRDIAQGKSKGYVFATTDEMNTWMEDQENVAKLSISDNLYIVDKQVIDYWRDCINLRVLETELPDMRNVVTTLGATTGGGNAITDISFEGNILTPAKNTSFVPNNYDETITGQKTFNTTIHSVGIMVQTYDNNSVVCSGGGMKAIFDITSNYYNKSETYSQTETNNLLYNKANIGVSYTKGEDDALLLLEDDKIQLIDSYTKIETNSLINNKADSGVLYSKSETYAKDQVYTKSENDALLLLKADKTQLIDLQAKIETNSLLNNKADSAVSYPKGEDDALLLAKADKPQLVDSYTKGEDDALLLLKADKTQLIDSYTKGDTNNLSNNKADSGVSYKKRENDALLLLKADKIQLIDSYTKFEINNLLTNKANQSITYTKTETDYLLSQIDVEDVDLTDYYNKTKTDELLAVKAGAIQLSNYVTLGTSQTIIANKTFNNACGFVSTIDEMSTVTGLLFVKSGADDTVVLLGTGDTKPISQFTTTIDDSNYVMIDGCVCPFGGTYDEIQHLVENALLTQSEVDAKLSSKKDSSALGNLVNTIQDQTVNGSKTFTSNVSATG